jgi:formylglycine-generating enzyme required for sulfatase activity
LATRGQQLAELEKVPEQCRVQVRQVVESQLARERAGWSKLKEAEEQKRKQAQAAEQKRIADAAAAEERRRKEADAAEAQRREQAAARARHLREGFIMAVGGICAGTLLCGIIWAGAVTWQWVMTPVPPAPAAPLSEFQQAYAEKSGLPVRKTLEYNGVIFEFVLIPPGKFQMGQVGVVRSGTTRPVEITEPFYLLTTEVTQAMYQAVMGTNPSSFTGGFFSTNNRPVECLSWNEANEFCDRLSKALKVKIQLPTEAQWEYACRAGSTANYSFGDAEARLAEYAWYDGNSGEATHPVGTRKPNAWGLYDMHGNVCEWCLDAYRSDYEKLPAKNPYNVGQPNDHCVLRGGSWDYTSDGCRAAYRDFNSPDGRFYLYGFRLCCSP